VFFRRAHFVRAFAVLKEGVTPEQANAALQVEVERLKVAYPATNRVMGAGMMPFRDFLLSDVRKPVLILAGAVLVLLLLACANVANLALLRALGRQQEIALRGALGARRSRIAGMVVVEHAMLAVAGGALGSALSWVAMRTLGLTEFGVPAATSLAFDARVALFALGATLVCAALFAAAPLAMAVRQGDATLGGSSPSRGASRGPRMVRLTNALVTLEVALAVILVAGAALMAQTAYQLRHVDVGFRAENVLAVQFTVPASRYADRDAVVSFYDRLLEALEARPQLERAGIVANLPLAGTSWSSSFRVDGWPAERVGAEIIHRRADRAYFETVGTPLLQGRYLDATDRGDAPLAVVINETFAREHFAGEDPIGKRIVYDRVPTPESNWYTIVGVVGDQKQVSPARPARAEVFESRDQDWGRNNWVVMRAAVPPLEAVSTVRAVLREMDPLIPIATVRTLDEVKRASMAKESGVLGLLGAFGALALLLAAVGVYAVAAQGARARTKEIGIRIALGAAAGDILRLVLRRGFAAVGVGLGVGLVVTLVATRALDSLLYGVEATDPRTIAGVAVLLFVVGSVACWIPARRATRLDPVSSLRAD
jgi:putative ABC transport system permease protein